MREIILTCGQLTQVDDIFYEKLNSFTWCLTGKENKKYPTRSDNYNPITQYSDSIKLHQDVIKLSGQIVKSGFEIDHINGDRLDNQIQNLRVVTRTQNSFNKDPQSNNISGYPGICWSSRDSKWRVYIKLNGVQRHLGYSQSFEEAYTIRKQGEIDYGVAEYCRSLQ